ncbi:Chloroperoxidase [Thamnocephalis sphaerospora]|uniref:Chloroperoxidase n=1 Tax=Thamnocephalis sphaerospora TaxID=78915 RepID=A0A4P9XH08_9FUNG|nr:Chloroperoxidase [Thamnocephalis sphaerospora]|eukprot:RKP04927.1 Chloroperoxidase [Thamnocephalis sphaerospora]
MSRTPSSTVRPVQNAVWNANVLTQWRDGQGQERSPCPFLNAAANHGIINYSGREIQVDRLRHVLNAGFGLQGKILDTLMNGAQDFANKEKQRAQDSASNHFNLEQLLEHGVIEHDGSLTRERHTSADPKRALARNNAAIDGLLSHAENGYLTYSSVAYWRSAVRHKEEKDGLQPPTSIPWKSKLTAAGETVLLLEVIGRNGKLAVADAECFLKQERFPDGFTPVKPGELGTTYLGWQILKTVVREEYVHRFGKQKTD